MSIGRSRSPGLRCDRYSPRGLRVNGTRGWVALLGTLLWMGCNDTVVPLGAPCDACPEGAACEPIFLRGELSWVEQDISDPQCTQSCEWSKGCVGLTTRCLGAHWGGYEGRCVETCEGDADCPAGAQCVCPEDDHSCPYNPGTGYCLVNGRGSPVGATSDPAD